MRTFTYEFEELPLVIDNGIEAAFINGAVEVEYNREGEWGTAAVTVEGFGQQNPVTGRREWPQVPAPRWLHEHIVHRLEHEWSGKVQDAVNEQLESDHAAAADNAADHKREERYDCD